MNTPVKIQLGEAGFGLAENQKMGILINRIWDR